MDEKKHLKIETLNVEKFIKENNVQEITNPIYFISDGVPTPDGFLSNEIFGISKEERSNIFGYISLNRYFIDPLCYKKWCSIDRKLKSCIAGINNYKISPEGELVEDDNGECGLDFIRNNINKIKFKRNQSLKRNDNIEFLEKARKDGVLFTNKLIIIPPYYRDAKKMGNQIGVGEVNKLYNPILISAQAFKDEEDFGFTLTDLNIARVQDKLVEVYNWFTKEPNIGKKNGILRRAVMAKTTDKSSRLVLSSAILRVERVEDLDVDIEHCALPLASAVVNLHPFVLHWIRRFFETEFNGTNEKVLYDEKGIAKLVYVKDPSIQFSDDVINKMISRFVHGYSNRFIPISVELTDGSIRYMYFKGNMSNPTEKKEDLDTTVSSIYNRRLTWCDLFYMACVDVSKDKFALITRYPIDSFYGQFPNKINISSTKETVKAFVNNVYYPKYPLIREEDIGSNTSNTFKDTLNISNLNIGPIGADFDGDQVTVKVAWTDEANAELKEYMESIRFRVDVGGNSVRKSSNEAIQVLYNLTLILPETEKKLTKEVVFG